MGGSSIIPASYSRYSDDKQRAASIEDQERNQDKHAERLGLPAISLRYRDAALSGYKNDRPDYLRMLTDAKAKRFNVLLMDNLSRLGRDSVEIERCIRRLEFGGVRLLSVYDGYDSQQALSQRKSARFLKGFMNEATLDTLRAETHRGLYGQAEKGFNAGGRSYGYRHVAVEDPLRKDANGRSKLIGVLREIDPEQAHVVRQIFTWFAEGRSPFWIARELNARRVAPSRGTSWARSSVYGDRRTGVGILSNPLYRGQYLWNRSEWVRDPDTKRRSRVARPEADWVTTDAPHLRIVSVDLWNAVQARLKATRNISIQRALCGKATGGRSPKYLFSGMLRCACGANYVMVNATKYGCAAHKERGDSVCANGQLVARLLIESALLAGVKQELLCDAAIANFKSEYARQVTEHNALGDGERIATRIQALDRQIGNLVSAVCDGAYSATLRTSLETAEREREYLSKELSRASRPTIPQITRHAEQAYRDMVENLEAWVALDITTARTHITDLFGGEPIRLKLMGSALEAEVTLDIGGLFAKASGAEKTMVAGARYVRNLPIIQIKA